MHDAFSFRTPPHIVFRPRGAGEAVCEALLALGVRRPLIVTDPGVVAAGLVAPVLAALKEAGCAPQFFDGVVADPPEAVIHAGVTAGRAHGADGFVGLGGGSSLDAAKLVAVLMGSDQPLDAMYGVDRVTGPRGLPLVQVPTTAGTGSEVTPVAVVTTGETTKMGVVSPALYADAAILDPDLTLGLPAQATAATGVDAMVHAIEAFTSARLKNPMSDALAKEALRLLAGALPRVLARPGDRAARGRMLYGACLAGQAFANAPVAAVHALAYPLGGRFKLAHGLSNALLLIPVLRFNRAEAADLYAELAPLVRGDIDGRADAETLADLFIEHMEALVRESGLPLGLAAHGVGEGDIPTLAEDAMAQTRLLINNPRAVSEADARALYAAAL